MTRAEYFRYIVDVHGKLARDNPLTLRRYVQNHVDDSAFGAQGQAAYSEHFHRDSVTELYFASVEDLQSNLGHEYTRTVIAPDGAHFAEIPTNQTLLTRELGAGFQESAPVGTKVMHFLAISEGMTVNDVQSEWEELQARAYETSAEITESFIACSTSVVLTSGPAAMLARHFGEGTGPEIGMVTSIWLKNSDLSAFRKYQQALMASGQFDAAASYFLIVREVEIFNSAAG